MKVKVEMTLEIDPDNPYIGLSLENTPCRDVFDYLQDLFYDDDYITVKAMAVTDHG